jgi:RNA polymerase sigma-70 factor (ECF subfamily)
MFQCGDARAKVKAVIRQPSPQCMMDTEKRVVLVFALELTVGFPQTSSTAPMTGGNISCAGRSYDCCGNMADGLDFESVVARYYEPLYQFAFSLTRAEADACDLTQQTFYVWATKGHQLRDPAKVKTWLFTTLHRQFLESRRRLTRFPHNELDAASHELPVITPEMANQLDSAQVLQALQQVDEIYQAPVALFYLEDCSYKEIAEILEVPMGTVKSRISRGIGQLQSLLADELSAPRRKPDAKS